MCFQGFPAQIRIIKLNNNIFNSDLSKNLIYEYFEEIRFEQLYY